MYHPELIAKMTIREKAALLTGKNEWAARGYQHLAIPELTFADGPSGVRKQRGNGDHLGLQPSVPATCFPSPATLANSWDIELEQEVGEALAKEAILEDVEVLLAPGLNLKRNPRCGRNFEYYSEDPYLSGKMAAAMIRGIQKMGVGACAKHFAVNSQEERRMSLNAVLDERTLREMYLTGFEIAVKEGNPWAVMSSYNEVNGTYVNENSFLLKQILRKEWGFQGFVVTDWGGDNDFVEGIRNGSNLQMPGCGLESAANLVQAVRQGKISESEVDERVDELLHAVLHISEKTSISKNKLVKRRKEVLEDHHELAEKAAAESIVLLKNEDHLLPLSLEKTIAIIGDFAFEPRFQGSGSSCVHAVRVDSISEKIKENSMNLIGMARGYQRNGQVDLKKETEALELAEKAEVVLFFLGLSEQEESEGLDRKNINIPQNQLDLLHKISKKNSSVVAVLCTGSVVTTWWKTDCKAILHIGLSGEAGAGAIQKILFGQVTPSGKLTETWLRSYDDTPSFPTYPAKGRNLEYREGIFVGYRYFERNQIPVSFPFGYGLSYTSFAYRDLKISSRGVSVTVKNTGVYDGSEVVQMYVSFPKSSVDRPEKELKGFAKQFLYAGEEKTIFIPFDDKTFRFFSVETGKWEVESTICRIMVGAGSQDIRLTMDYEVEGTWNGQYRLNGQQDFVFEDEQENRVSKRKKLTSNDPLCDMQFARNPFARFLAIKMKEKITKIEKNGEKVDLNLLFRYNMPFRAIAKMTQGIVSMKMVEGILRIVNGNFFTGVYQVIIGFFHNRRQNKAFENALLEDANTYGKRVRNE